MVDIENALLLYMYFWPFIKSLHSHKVLPWKQGEVKTPVFCIGVLRDF
jgi:hypothetical protein